MKQPFDTNRKMGRSDFLRSGFRVIRNYFADSIDKTIEKKANKLIVPLLRPPGAINELDFLLKCSRCDDCVKACPGKAITRAEPKYGTAMGTPIIDPQNAPCLLCKDLPCVKSCSENALIMPKKIKMGTAFVIKNRCFAFNGQICDYCYDRCPLKDKAISMADRLPVVMEKDCAGCGICEYYCPATGNGIIILPESSKLKGLK